MLKIPRLASRKIIAALLRAGFYIHHQTGSHANLRHISKTYLHVVIPRHSSDLAPKTIKSILAQAELTIETLKELL